MTDLTPIIAGIFAFDDSAEVLGLRAAHCSQCDRTTFPYTGRCSWCYSSKETDPVVLTGEGVVFESTMVFSPAPGLAAPYIVGYVDLPEGVRLFTQLVSSGGGLPPAGSRATFQTIKLQQHGEPRLAFAFKVSEMPTSKSAENQEVGE